MVRRRASGRQSLDAYKTPRAAYCLHAAPERWKGEGEGRGETGINRIVSIHPPGSSWDLGVSYIVLTLSGLAELPVSPRPPSPVPLPLPSAASLTSVSFPGGLEDVSSPFPRHPIYFVPSRRSGRFAAISSLSPSPSPPLPSRFLGRGRARIWVCGISSRWCNRDVATRDSCNSRKRAGEGEREFSPLAELRGAEKGADAGPSSRFTLYASVCARVRDRIIASPGVITIKDARDIASRGILLPACFVNRARASVIRERAVNIFHRKQPKGRGGTGRIKGWERGIGKGRAARKKATRLEMRFRGDNARM